MPDHLPQEQFPAPSHGFSIEEAFETLPPAVRRWLRIVKVDLGARHGQPSPVRWGAALIVANGGSLISDAILVAIGTTIFRPPEAFRISSPQTTESSQSSA
jgi:hypothetical protein